MAAPSRKCIAHPQRGGNLCDVSIFGLFQYSRDKYRKSLHPRLHLYQPFHYVGIHQLYTDNLASDQADNLTYQAKFISKTKKCLGQTGKIDCQQNSEYLQEDPH